MVNSQPIKESEDPLPAKEDEDPLLRRTETLSVDRTLHGSCGVLPSGMHHSIKSCHVDVRSGIWEALKPSQAMPAFGILPEDTEAVRGVLDEFHYDCRPGETMTQERFLKWAEDINKRRAPDDDSVFVFLGPDGSVQGVTEKFESKPGFPRAVVVKHNHHDPLDPPDTPSSAMQLLRDLEQGRFVPIADAKRRHVFHMYLENHDEDMDSYVWLVKNWRKIYTDPNLHARVAEFLKLQDTLDKNAGLVPVWFDAREGTDEAARALLIRQNMWVFQPYASAPKGTDLESGPMLDVIRQVCDRLDAFARGEAGLLDPDTRHVLIAEGDGWCMYDGAKSGKHAKFELSKNHRVVIRADITRNGTYHYGYSIGQVAEEFLPMDRVPHQADLTALSAHMNTLEDIDETEEDKWGGRRNVIGPPKLRKSSLSHDRLIEEFLKFYR
jgi:hypothetical protein